MSKSNSPRNSPKVSFENEEPSKREYFEVYNRYNRLNMWFVLLFLLRGVAPFCLALQTRIFDYPHSIGIFFEHYIINESVSGTLFFYEAKCFKQETTIRLSFEDHCKRGRVIVEMNICRHLGVIIGAILAGILADLFGRRSTGFYFSILWSLFSWLFVVMPTIRSAKLCFIALSICCTAVNLTTYINFLEIANKKNRVTAVYTIHMFMGGAFLIQFSLAQISEWKSLSSFNASCVLIMILATWYTPESPRWLWCKDRRKEAYSQLEEISGKTYTFKQTVPEIKPRTIWKVLKEIFLTMAKKFKDIAIFYLLWAIAVLFYSSSRWDTILMYSKSEQYQHLSAFAEVTSFLFFIPLYMFLGKRYGLLAIYVLLGAQTPLGFIKSEKSQVLYNAFSILLSITAINFIRLYLAEVFPTFLRATVVGFCYSIFGIASIAGILVANLYGPKFNYNYYYYVAFLLAALLGGLAYFLPTPKYSELH